MDEPNDSFTKKIDYIIILGSGVRSEEVPPLLKSRLDKGIEYYQKNPTAKFVVSGGQGRMSLYQKPSPCENTSTHKTFLIIKFFLKINPPLLMRTCYFLKG